MKHARPAFPSLRPVSLVPPGSSLRRVSPSLVSLALPLVLVTACGASGPDADVRDIRPTQMERGDVVTVEARAPLYTVGAPTAVIFDQVKIIAGGPSVTVVGRAVSPTRVLFDAQSLAGVVTGHLNTKTTITVDQGLPSGHAVFHSAPSSPFELDFFPRSLQHLAQGYSDRVESNLWDWLGLTVTERPESGIVGGVTVAPALLVSDVQAHFNREQIEALDMPPLDGKIEKTVEAHVGQPGGLTEAQWKKLDLNHDGYIERYELDELSAEDGTAAKAGLQVGDVIATANGKPIITTADLVAAWDGAGDKVILGVVRGPAKATIELPRFGRPFEIPSWLIWALVMALAAGIVALPVPVIGGLIVVWERKISAYMQSRIGPNRVGPGGWLQWLADGLKLIMKEDLVPDQADAILFKASPYLAFVGLFLVFMVIPFTGWVIVADLNIGLLFLLSVTSLIVVSIIMGGWSSNSKWSLLGGMRSAAQIISYELPASVSLLTIATLTGSLSTEAIVRAQGGWPWQWYLFHNPFTFVAFFIYFISALAEGNRTPFDLPEAESELVSGFNTEYSGFRFSLFPLVEWVNLFVIGAVAGLLFCGGWQVPGVSVEFQDAHGYMQLIGAGVFLVKILFFIFVIIWIRWTLPRFRVDQMMNLCWKYFIPISFVCFVGVLAFAWLIPPMAQQIVHVLMFVGAGLLPGFAFFRRVQYNRTRYKELNLNPLL